MEKSRGRSAAPLRPPLAHFRMHRGPTGQRVGPPLVQRLTQDENGDPIEDGSHVGQQPHDHSQLWKKNKATNE